MEVLVFLATHAGQVVSKQRILESVWAGIHVSSKVLTYSVSELRRALEDDSKAPVFIQTIPRKGYRLISPVRALVREADRDRGSPGRFRHLLCACRPRLLKTWALGVWYRFALQLSRNTQDPVIPS
jgi:hypothetical protein